MTDSGGSLTSLTYGALVWQMFRRNRPAVVALVVIIVLAVIGTFAPFLANSRPLLVRVNPDRTTPLVTYEGQEKIARVGWFSPVLENLSRGDIVVLIVFAWATVQCLFRLLTVPRDNPTRRVFRLPRRLRKYTLWTLTLLAVLLTLRVMSGPERLPDTNTDWRALVADPCPGDVFYMPPVAYLPYQQNLDDYLCRPSWQGPTLRDREDDSDLTKVEGWVPRDAAERERLEREKEAERQRQRREREARLAAPRDRLWYHWLGTDHMGRDTASQLVHGARISLVVGFVSVGIALVIGTFVGALGGYFGGKVDFWVMRFIEVIMCFPTIFLILTVSVMLEKRSIWSVMVVIGITGWTGSARLVRGEFFKQRAMEYETAARAIGGTPLRVMFRHILPNAMAPLLVGATFGIAGAILTESTLSFLNLGVPPDVASWGRTLSYGIENVKYGWWLILFPGLIIFITVTCYNLAGEGLRDAIDPRMRQ